MLALLVIVTSPALTATVVPASLDQVFEPMKLSVPPPAALTADPEVVVRSVPPLKLTVTGEELPVKVKALLVPVPSATGPVKVSVPPVQFWMLMPRPVPVLFGQLPLMIELPKSQFTASSERPVPLVVTAALLSMTTLPVFRPTVVPESLVQVFVPVKVKLPAPPTLTVVADVVVKLVPPVKLTVIAEELPRRLKQVFAPALSVTGPAKPIVPLVLFANLIPTGPPVTKMAFEKVTAPVEWFAMLTAPLMELKMVPL